MTAPSLLSLPEVADRLGCGVGTVRGLVRRGELRTVPLGQRYVRVTSVELDRFVANLDRRAYGLPAVTPDVEVEQARLRLVGEAS